MVWRGFCLVDDGIYFIPEPGADGKYSIQFLSFATGTVKSVAPIPRPSFFGMTVSPDDATSFTPSSTKLAAT